ncbi:MAG: MBG domain-containing protein [Clostridia bacterium]|nr:MBG domain-containing protein [Clostridia bacterium]
MKRKLNARTITLISLIAALICAVIAGFALSNLNENASTENSNCIAKPEHSASTTWVDYGTKDDGYDDWYDDDDSYYYYVEYSSGSVIVGDVVYIRGRSDDYTARLVISGVKYNDLGRTSDGKSIIQPTEVGELEAWVDSDHGSSYSISIRVTSYIVTEKEDMGDYYYWLVYDTGVMHVGDTQTVYAVTDNPAFENTSKLKWDVWGQCTVLDGGDGCDYVTIKATALGSISFYVDFGPIETSTETVRVTSNIVEGLVHDGGNDYWIEIASKTMKVGERQTIYYYTTNKRINTSNVGWTLYWIGTSTSSRAKIVAGGNGYNYITIEAVAVGYIGGYEDSCAPTETGSFSITIEKGDYNMSDVTWVYSSAFTYDGSTKTIYLTGLPSGVTANYSNNSKVNAGTYSASVSSWNYDSTNYNAPSSVASKSWTINRATIDEPTFSKTNFDYSTSQQSFTISSTSYMTITLPSSWTRNGSTIYIPANTAASTSSYDVVLKPDSNHQWRYETPEAGLTGTRTTYIYIRRAAINEPTLSKSSTTYSQSSQDFTISSTSYMTITPPTGWSRNGTKITIPGGTGVNSYSVSVTPDSNHQWSSGSNVNSARLLPISITAQSITTGTVNLNQTLYVYSGSANKPSVTSVTVGSETVPTSDYTVAYSANINAGTATVTVTGKNNYKDSCSTTFTIDKATPTGLSVTPEAGTHVAGAALATVGFTSSNTGGINGTFNWTDPSTTLALGSSTYGWTFTPTDTVNYNNVTGTVTIYAVGLDSITVEGGKSTYKAYESYTTAGLKVYAVASGVKREVFGYTVSIPYEDAGRSSFLVSDNGCVVTISYSEGDKTATTTIAITVEKADYNMSGVSLNGDVVTYDGSAHSITYSGTLPAGVYFSKYTYNGKILNEVTNAGNYEVKALFTIDDTANRNIPELVATLTINKATPTATANVQDGTYYVGDELGTVPISVGTYSVRGSISWTTSESTLTGTANSYGWTFVPDDSDNYATITGTIKVTACYKLLSISVTGAKTTYKAHESFDTTGMVVKAKYVVGKSETTVTGYTVSYPTNGANEFFITDNGGSVTITYEENGITVTANVTVTITQNSYDMTGVTMTDVTVTYDGKAHSITCTSALPNGVTITGYTYNGDAATSATKAGTYTVAAVFKIDDAANYEMPKLSATLTINKATQTITVDNSKTAYTYNGELQTVEGIASVKDTEQTVKYTDNEFTTVAEGNALSVKVYVEETDNYEYAEKFVTITVNKAQVSLTWTGGDGVYDGKEHNATLTVADGVFTRDASTFTTDTLKGHITVSYTTSDGNAERTNVGTYAPSYTGYPSGEPFCNYTPVVSNPSYTFEITQATVTGLEFNGDSFEYDGTSHTIEISGTLPDGVTVKYYHDKKEFKGVTDVGTYTITAEFECTDNYVKPADKTATIIITSRAIANGDVSNINSTYTYKGEAWEPDPEVVLTLNGATSATTLVAGTDYKVTYTPDSADGYSAGTTVTVTVEGIGNYSGTVTKTFTIEKATITREWENGDSFTYDGQGQGSTVKFSGIADSDANTVKPVVKYKGSGSTEYAESEILPVDAGNYIATVYFVLANDNYISKVVNNEFKRFTIKQAHVNVEAHVEDNPPYYAGSALPIIEVKSSPEFNGIAVTGKIEWQNVGNARPSLKDGTNAYVWVFTPDDKNFAPVTGTYTIAGVLMPNISSITVDWKDGIPHKLYTSTTLDGVREYIVVKGIIDKDHDPIEIADYELTGDWGTGDIPSGSRTLTINVNISDNSFTEFFGVDFEEVSLSRIEVTTVDGGSIKTKYEAFDKFDRSKIIVTAVYNDGKEVVVEDYEIVYPDESKDCFWAGEGTQTLTIKYKDADPHKISVSVSKKTYDLSGLGIDKTKTETYDGEVKSYSINGTFGLGKVEYAYSYYENGEWKPVSESEVKDAGTYKVTIGFTIVGEDNIANYEAIETQEVTLVINKAVYDNVDKIGFATTSYVFGNSVEDNMAVQNVPDGVTVVYEYKDSTGKVLTADEVVNAGVYSVTAKFVTDENHAGIKSKTTKFTIEKATPAVNPIVGGSLSKGTKLYELTFADDGAVAGTFKWVNDEQELQAGVNRCHYTFTPDDSANYKTVSGYIDLSVGSISEGEVANGGNLSAGLTAAIIVSMAACLAVAIIALILAVKKPKTADADGFYEYASEEDLK